MRRALGTIFGAWGTCVLFTIAALGMLLAEGFKQRPSGRQEILRAMAHPLEVLERLGFRTTLSADWVLEYQMLSSGTSRLVGWRET